MLEQIPGEKHVTVGGDKVDTRDFVIFGVSSNPHYRRERTRPIRLYNNLEDVGGM
jgi:hypothetical protein